jgi:hypothetical protein
MKIFLATPMEQLSDFEKEVAFELQRLLNKEYGETSTFLAASEFPTPDTFLPPRDSFDFVTDLLKAADLVVMYYPRKVATGALVELGYALAIGKRVISFSYEDVLPYMVREGAPNMERFILDTTHNLHALQKAYHLFICIKAVL